MTATIIFQVLLFAFALSMDAFAVSITDGLVYKDITKKKSVFIASVFGLMQGIMPLIGYWVVELIKVSVNQTASVEAGKIMSTVISWVAFALLLFVGFKMLFDSIKELKDKKEKEPKSFSIKEVLLYGLLTSIDAFAIGVTFNSGISTNVSIWLHASLIIVMTFIISLLGLLLGKVFNRLLKGNYNIAGIIGGSILICLAVWVIVSHYIG